MSHRPVFRDEYQVKAYLLEVSDELQQMEESLLRMRHRAAQLLAASERVESGADPLERMYEDLERAIRPGPPEEAAASAAPASAPSRRAPRAARPRVVPLAPSRVHVVPDMPLQVVPPSARTAATSTTASR